MRTGERKQELDVVMEHASCAGDNYYFDMEQKEFHDEMPDNEEEKFYKGNAGKVKLVLRRISKRLRNRLQLSHRPKNSLI